MYFLQKILVKRYSALKTTYRSSLDKKNIIFFSLITPSSSSFRKTEESTCYCCFSNIMISYYVCTVLPPNSLFLGPGIFRESEIRELKIFTYSIIFLPIHYIIMVKSQIQQFSSQFTISLW